MTWGKGKEQAWGTGKEILKTEKKIEVVQSSNPYLGKWFYD